MYNLAPLAEQIANLRSLIRRTKRQVRNNTMDPVKGSRIIIRATATLLPLSKTYEDYAKRNNFNAALRKSIEELNLPQFGLTDPTPELDPKSTPNTQTPRP